MPFGTACFCEKVKYSECHCYESTALVGAEDHFGPGAGVGTGPYSAFVPGGVFTGLDPYENAQSPMPHTKSYTLFTREFDVPTLFYGSG